MADTAHHKTLTLGQQFPHIVLPDHRGKRFDLEQLRGRPVLLFYFLNTQRPACIGQLKAFEENLATFEQLGISVIGISQDTIAAQAQCVKKLNLSYPLLADPSAAAAKELGIAKWQQIGPQEMVEITRSVFILDGSLRIRALYAPNKGLEQKVKELTELLPSILPENTPRLAAIQAPVLVIPCVLEPGLCQAMLQRPTLDDDFKSYFDRRLHQRVIPEIKKAFQYHPTRRETPLLLSREKGPVSPYTRFRSNVVPETAHRRYAIQIWLDSNGFEGGGTCFPEYGRIYYKPPAGHALVYSCELLQENLPVTQGKEIRIASYFYDEAQAQSREALAHQQGSRYQAGAGPHVDDPVFE